MVGGCGGGSPDRRAPLASILIVASEVFEAVKRSKAYRRIARNVGASGCVQILCGVRSGDRLPPPETSFCVWTEAAECEGQTS